MTCFPPIPSEDVLITTCEKQTARPKEVNLKERERTKYAMQCVNCTVIPFYATIWFVQACYLTRKGKGSLSLDKTTRVSKIRMRRYEMR